MSDNAINVLITCLTVLIIIAIECLKPIKKEKPKHEEQDKKN